MKVFSLLSVLVWLVIASPAQATAGTWQSVAQELDIALNKAGDAYANGDIKAAKKAVLQAYFGIFESRKMEAAMRTALGIRHTYEVESQFGQLRKAIKNGENIQTIRNHITTLNAALSQDAATLDEARIPAEVFEVNK